MSDLTNIQQHLEAIADVKAKALLQNFTSILVEYDQRITDIEDANLSLIARISALEAGEAGESGGGM